MICSKSKQINSSYKLIIIVHNAYRVSFISISIDVSFVCVCVYFSILLFIQSLSYASAIKRFNRFD